MHASRGVHVFMHPRCPALKAASDGFCSPVSQSPCQSPVGHVSDVALQRKKRELVSLAPACIRPQNIILQSSEAALGEMAGKRSRHESIHT